MRHYVLTRSAYGPEWDLEANRRRLRVTEAVTARLMARQTDREWTWIVLVDERDPQLRERLAVFASAAPELIPILWTPSDPRPAAWDRHGRSTNTVQRIAATAYRAPWAEHLDRSGWTLQTRLDDDDGLALDALQRIRTASRPLRERTILIQPVGFRTWAGRAMRVVHTTNAMQTLATPPGDRLTVYDYGHRNAAGVAPILTVDREPAWLWVRHPDTISGHRNAAGPISRELRRLFPIDWTAIS